MELPGASFQTRKAGERLIALAGNPNVGKSTVFNALTGMHQHTGNWPGKTVSGAAGRLRYEGESWILADLPGTYSLLTRSAEEDAARDFLCFGGADAVIVLCDAGCLERNLNLVLQILEITPKVVVGVNLMDEARRKGAVPNLGLLRERLGVPVVPLTARDGEGLEPLLHAVGAVCREPPAHPARVEYPPAMRTAAELLAERLPSVPGFPSRFWMALRLLEDADFFLPLFETHGGEVFRQAGIRDSIAQSRVFLEQQGLWKERRERMASAAVQTAAKLTDRCIPETRPDFRLDALLTGKYTGLPLMLLLLALILWLTIAGANYPSALLSGLFSRGQERLAALLIRWKLPVWFRGLLTDGIYRVLSWVVAVMLPPMAIFFPLFTFLEDLGYLPRVAFNLDHCFRRCGACGKQALTMCMGFGCNAAAVVGCRIIDSPRERLIAILTNSFVPCNGRFPLLITLIAVFFAGKSGWRGAVLLTGFLLAGILMTFLCSALLSATVLKGVPSSFTLELPPFRPPQPGRILVRSLFDRTIFVLGRAVLIAAPAGALIYLLANTFYGGSSLLLHLTRFLDPIGRLLGMDGVLLTAFLLGFPANEIVLPIAVMCYTAGQTLPELAGIAETRALLLAHGWTPVTAVCVMVFSLMHWPCSTTCLTVWKETRQIKWTAAAVLLPTLTGAGCCLLISSAARIFGL